LAHIVHNILHSATFSRKNILSKEELKELSGVIAETEKKTSGEIRIVLRKKKQFNEMNLSVRDIALNEFFRLGMQNTRDKTGVLIFILLSEKKLYIAADEAINSRVEQRTWEKIAENMSVKFRGDRFLEGLTEAVQSVGLHLRTHFPRKRDDKNELPDEVIIR
jgi:uncharacterized membrane protein